MTFANVLTDPICGRRNAAVDANSSTGIAVPNTPGAQAPIQDAGAFFMPASPGAHARQQFMAGGAGEPQGSPVPGSGTAIPRRPPPFGGGQTMTGDHCYD